MTRSATSWLARKAPGLAQHGVDQGGLAVVDVGDDGHVAEVTGSGFGGDTAGPLGGERS